MVVIVKRSNNFDHFVQQMIPLNKWVVFEGFSQPNKEWAVSLAERESRKIVAQHGYLFKTHSHLYKTEKTKYYLF